jgi:hypothetical protein
MPRCGALAHQLQTSVDLRLDLPRTPPQVSELPEQRKYTFRRVATLFPRPISWRCAKYILANRSFLATSSLSMVVVEPTSVHQRVRKPGLGDNLSGIITVPPYPWDGAKPGKCYVNVREMIKRHGGQYCYGWALTDFGPHRCSGSRNPPPLYRRWLNHVVWRDRNGLLWEVTQNAVIDNRSQTEFAATEFLPDPEATFEIRTGEEWVTRPTRYVSLRPEGIPVVRLLAQAQHATGEARSSYLQQALAALRPAGFTPREWKVESIGDRTGSIWLLAD